jgi:hypothetical protein
VLWTEVEFSALEDGMAGMPAPFTRSRLVEKMKGVKKGEFTRFERMVVMAVNVPAREGGHVTFTVVDFKDDGTPHTVPVKAFERSMPPSTETVEIAVVTLFGGTLVREESGTYTVVLLDSSRYYQGHLIEDAGYVSFLRKKAAAQK